MTVSYKDVYLQLQKYDNLLNVIANVVYLEEI